MFSTTTTTILFGLAALGFTSAAPTSNSQLEARATHEGTATYYYQGGNPGSCGDWHSGESFPFVRSFPSQRRADI
jgi:hypothetical protein